MENKFYKIENCSCGKTHFCDIEGVFICDGATKKLSSLLEKYSKVLVVADENTYNASGSYVETAISDKIVDKVIFSGDKILIPDEIAILAVEKHLISVDFILGIGSGVIQDLCKYVSHTSKIPYGVVATAPSMDGYCSDGSAMITGGMKVTYKAGLPRFIVAEPSVTACINLSRYTGSISASLSLVLSKNAHSNNTDGQWKMERVIYNVPQTVPLERGVPLAFVPTPYVTSTACILS